MPSAVICDNAKEMVVGEFNRKLKEASCHLKQMKPFTPWSNAAEREMKEPKKDFGRKLIKSGTQRDFGMIALSLSPTWVQILHMAFANWMVMSLKPLCLTRHLTLPSFVRLNDSIW